MPPQRGRTPRCIILAPTRELAKQVEREFQESAPGLTVGCFYGGKTCPALAFLPSLLPPAQGSTPLSVQHRKEVTEKCI